MIFFYSVHEKILKEVKTNSSFGEVHIIVSQRYVSMLIPGPLMPYGIKDAKVYDKNDQEIGLTEWDADLKTKVKEAKASVPFQIGFFRNLFIVIAILAAFGIFNRYRLSQKKQEKIVLDERIGDMKQGDIYRVTFHDQSTLQIGLIKVNAMAGDTIKFVRSSETKETRGIDEEVSFTEFRDQEERVSFSILKKTKGDRSLVTYPTEEKRGEVIGRITAVQN